MIPGDGGFTPYGAARPGMGWPCEEQAQGHDRWTVSTAY